MFEKIKSVKIYGIPLAIYLIVYGMVIVIMRLRWIPDTFLGTFLILVLTGGLFHEIGKFLPIIRTYFGGGTFVCIFGAAAMKYFHFFPEELTEQIGGFLNKGGFLELFISALIVGSILSMDRELLMKASVRFLPICMISMVLSVLSASLLGELLGYGFKDTMMLIAFPMMAGGMGAGVVPLSGMYTAALHLDSSYVLARMVPASTLGNVGAIMMSSLLARFSEKRPELTGYGKLMRNKNREEETERKKEESIPLTVQNLGTGFTVVLFFYLGALIIAKLIPAVHLYAWMILLAGAVRIADVVPLHVAECTRQWSQLVMQLWTHAILIGIGIALIDIETVAAACTPMYLVLIVFLVLCVTVYAGILGHLVGFYPVEASITAGLCTTNMGGTGNIAVLSAGKRMELLPFAQLATRVGGSAVLVTASILLKILY